MPPPQDDRIQSGKLAGARKTGAGQPVARPARLAPACTRDAWRRTPRSDCFWPPSCCRRGAIRIGAARGPRRRGRRRPGEWSESAWPSRRGRSPPPPAARSGLRRYGAFLGCLGPRGRRPDGAAGSGFFSRGICRIWEQRAALPRFYMPARKSSAKPNVIRHPRRAPRHCDPCMSYARIKKCSPSDRSQFTMRVKYGYGASPLEMYNEGTCTLA